MRLWSIHPKYLDAAGLVALWRETLLAKAVLSGNTKGYKNHSQLERFKACQYPVSAINYYLNQIYNESVLRGYKFNPDKIGHFTSVKMNVTTSQIIYEFKHLMNKLKVRDIHKYNASVNTKDIESNNIFNVITGSVESWEKIKSS